MSAPGRQRVPAQRVRQAAGRALAAFVEQSQVELRHRMTLHGGPGKPFARGPGVALQPLAAQIHAGEIGLRARQAVVRGPPVPFGGGGEILGHAQALAVEMRDIALGGRIVVPCQRQPGLEGRLVVPGIVSLHTGREIRPRSVRRAGEQDSEQDGGQQSRKAECGKGAHGDT